MEIHEIILIPLIVGILTAYAMIRLRFVSRRRRLWILDLLKVLR
jgi:hypothetical protein